MRMISGSGAASALALVWLGTGAVPAAAQQDVPAPPPDLRGFSLPPGNSQASPEDEIQAPRLQEPIPGLSNPTTTPTPTPAPAPSPSPAAPPPVVRPITPPSATTTSTAPRAEPSSTTRQIAPAEQASAPRKTPDEPQPGPAATSTPEAAPEATNAPQQQPAVDSPPEAEAVPTTTSSPPERETEGFPWWIAVLALAAVLGAAFLFRRRRQSAPIDAAPPVPAVAPKRPVSPPPAAPAPEPVAEKVPPSEEPRRDDRPWLELEFIPLKAGATPFRASVQYRLQVRNSGTEPARNVRVGARMFNAGPQQDTELQSFFATDSSTAALNIDILAPGEVRELQDTVALPSQEVHPIVVQGRTIFVPVVGFNLLYDYGEGLSGQTALSFIVGRETPVKGPKMAPFRLDLGPKIYGSVGQRRHAIASVR